VNGLFETLNQAGVRYLLIGGHAVRLSGLPRHTLDWDLFIPARDADNLDRLNRALAENLDLPVVPLGPRGEAFVQTYRTRWGVVQFHLGDAGLPPFDEAERRAVVRQEGGESIRTLCDGDLLLAKKATGRPRDVQDIEFLEEKLRLSRRETS
jgi:hypothetical protein